MYLKLEWDSSYDFKGTFIPPSRDFGMSGIRENPNLVNKTIAKRQIGQKNAFDYRKPEPESI